MKKLIKITFIAALLVGVCSTTPLVAGADTTSAVYNWGQIGDGGYGIGGGQTHNVANSPVAVAGLGNVTTLAASNSDGYAITTSGTELAWGYGKRGELGDGHSGSNSFGTPVTVAFPSGTVVAAIGEAQDDGFAVDSNGQPWAWGQNAGGQLCNGTTTKSDRPQAISLPTTATAVAGGANHVMWLTTAGTVYTCGVGNDGELGNGTFNTSSTPVQVIGLPSGDPVVAISAGDLTNAALTQSGTLWMWGAGSHGELGDGSNANSDVPVQVAGTWAQIYDGGSTGTNPHAIGITTAGVVKAWGANKGGELGDGKKKKSNIPVAVSVPTGVTFTSVMAGGLDSGAIDSDGNVWMWGSSQNGVLGNGRSTGNQLTPIKVDSGKTMLTGTAANVIDG